MKESVNTGKRIFVSSLIVAGVFLTACTQSPVSSSSSNTIVSSAPSSISAPFSEYTSSGTPASDSIVNSVPFPSSEFDMEEFAPYFKRLTNYFSESGQLAEIPKAGFVLEELAGSGNYQKGSYTIDHEFGSSTFECYYIPRKDVEKKVESIFFDPSTDFLDNCLNNPGISWLQEENINDENFILYGIVLESSSSEVEIEKYSLVKDELIVEAFINRQALAYTFKGTANGDYLLESIKQPPL